MSIVKYIKLIAIFATVSFAYYLPLDVRKPVADGIPTEGVSIKENKIKVVQVASFELKDPVPVNVQDYAKIEWRKHGWSDSDWNALVKLWGNESGWRTDAVNPKSGACGIPQALPCSKIGPNWRDPATQLAWGANYIKERYGTPSQALAFWYAQCGTPLHCWY